MDPVLHLVRNAVSHGFEPPAARRAAGKPEEGTLTLAAASVGEAVVLEIADDGRGIDAEAVAARARALGLPAARRADRRGDAARHALRARVLDPRRNRSRERPRRRHGGRQDHRRRAERDDDAADRARRRHPVRDRAAADAVDHRRADRPRRRPDLRGAAGGGARGGRDRSRGRAARSRGTSSRRSAAARCRSSGSARIFGVPERAAARAARLRRRVRASTRSASRSIASPASARSSCAAMADALIKVDGVSGATDLGDGRVVLILDLPALARGAPADRRVEVAPMTEPFILFTVAGTTYALRSRDVAHVEMVDQITGGAQRGAFRRRRGVLARPGGAGAEPARAVRVRARALRSVDPAAGRARRRAQRRAGGGRGARVRARSTRRRSSRPARR